MAVSGLATGEIKMGGERTRTSWWYSLEVVVGGGCWRSEETGAGVSSETAGRDLSPTLRWMMAVGRGRLSLWPGPLQ